MLMTAPNQNRAQAQGPSPIPTGRHAGRRRRVPSVWRVFFSLLTLCLLPALPTTAAAQSCWVSGAVGMAFGAVSAVSPTDSQTSVPFTCGNGSTPTYVRVCLYIAGGSPVSDVEPRKMTNYVGSYLNYNLFADAARTQIIGPKGGGYPVYTATLLIPGNGGYAQATGSIPVYGRVFAGQGTIPSGNYASQIPSGQLQYQFGSGAFPPDCNNGTDINIGFSGISASVPSGCRLTALSDLDFGVLASPLSAAYDQSATVTLRCPSGTPWQIALSAGNHHNGTRRMSNGMGSFVSYELYRNAGRTQVWGSTTGADTASGTGTGVAAVVPIHGRIPMQGSVSTGTFTDVVVVTLTY